MDGREEDYESTLVTPEECVAGFSSVVGLDHVKQLLMESIILPLTMPLQLQTQLFRGLRKGSQNVLLYGPPGCGKTMLARAAASESRAVFFNVHPSDLLSKFMGSSERRLSLLFQEARRYPKSCLFFDEFDAIAAQRQSGDQGATAARQLLCQLLLLMNATPPTRPTPTTTVPTYARSGDDGGGSSSWTPPVYAQKRLPMCFSDKSTTPSLKRHRSTAHDSPDDLCVLTGGSGSESGSQGEDEVAGNLVVIAATNRVEDLDEAILRRFACKIFVGVPNANDRRELLLCHLLKDIDTGLSDGQVDEIVAMTKGWNPSEIESLTREAVMRPLRDVQSTLLALRDVPLRNASIPHFVPPLRPVYLQDFLHAYERMLMSTQSNDNDGEDDCLYNCDHRENHMKGEGEMEDGMIEENKGVSE